MISINQGDAIGSGGAAIGGAGIAGTMIAITRCVGITVLEQPQTVAASAHAHTDVKKKPGRFICGTVLEDHSAFAEKSSDRSLVVSKAGLVGNAATHQKQPRRQSIDDDNITYAPIVNTDLIS
ncbi:protein of unknown function (plasmid) [Caballeronia sp. S22]